MAWIWSGQAYERKQTTNLIDSEDGPRPSDGLPPRPDGEGWERFGEPSAVSYPLRAKRELPKALAQSWVRKPLRERGYCGRVGPDSVWGDGQPF